MQIIFFLNLNKKYLITLILYLKTFKISQKFV